MKITSFDTGLYSVPLTESWGSSNYLFTSLEFVVVWLHTDTGHTGTGWSPRRPAARSRNRYPCVEPANGSGSSGRRPLPFRGVCSPSSLKERPPRGS